MHNKFDRRTFVWRLSSVIVCLIWIGGFLGRYFTFGIYKPLPVIFFTTGGFVIPIVFMAGLMVLLLIFPYQFFIHAVVFWTLGLAQLIGGAGLNALILHLLGYLFLYRQGFFITKPLPKLIAGGIILMAALASQLRFGYEEFLLNTRYLIDFLMVMGITALLFIPEIKYLKNREKDMILHLSSGIFEEKDAAILEKILAGEKYETIAKEAGMAISTLKKHIRSMFERLRVSDRVNFMSMYAKHKIVLGK